MLGPKKHNFIPLKPNFIFSFSGQPIPRIKYTPEEVATWKTIYRALTKLYDKYACTEFKTNWKELEALAGYRYNKTDKCNKKFG